MKNRLKEYFYFSKIERAGIISLIILITLLAVGRFLLITYYPQVSLEQRDVSELTAIVDSLQEAQSLAEEKEENLKERNISENLAELSDFNPNELRVEDWEKFGLSEKQAQSLLSYKSIIGGFKSKEQFRKVYVINDELHEKLSPHILLPEKEVQTANNAPRWEKKKYERKDRVYPKVNINEADTAAFKSLYGIGDFLANMIVKRREELGGFISKEQLKEVYGLKEETLLRLDTQLVFKPTTIRKININTAAKDELKAHPYIYWKYANVIVNYREQHGKYRQLEDLKNIVIINDSIFQKVKPYLEL
jgi:competence ComEA-like helix-hairpin-helix protein